ncbi:ABSCISIC ACID-INSENSITIVE 5-like protein 2 isoform X1 [Dioscorea cayenensis subsp. rotundata]|uniref:ABSCISIC ACID-INSENSITIVE 5-like protein 2 isoform X1 n=1 Tax=Dioscorea cayennensis subsp. rotundata TaxID=55577 RepID=A0AB40BQL6_DIOCR|nr:ABSCISIC ACID-INSENSITIVE 5-like protein 2 isoform X1 [Dioscorea cayenensis subsp. rotundata]XP_039129607.1 ABSCISIC ACID-INSENSITIVE 5-like protein 2 isoform X1 [Dioscorea cayenensis subsp. rotundata]
MVVQAMASGSLARQGSVYSLTLSEVENHLGEPLHSMNLDELLRNILPCDANTSLSMNIGSMRYSSRAVSQELSKKTVDEVWKEIQQLKNKGNEDRNSVNAFGEMTLEDFLMEVGVVSEKRIDVFGNANEHVHWLQQYQQMPRHILDNSVYGDTTANLQRTLVGTMSDPLVSGRKRMADEDMVEKAVDRRQKRMIKNRESAARSRARKQAYTNELENKVSRLEEENERLKKQKALDKILRSAPEPVTKNQLRRTISAPL